MSPASADARTAVKHGLAPLLAAGAGAWARVSGRAASGFQTIILHHVERTQYDALRGFLRLVQREYGFLTPAEAAHRLIGAGRAAAGANASPCLVTFDDGFSSALPVAREVLAEFGIKAIFFVCPGLVDLPASEREAAVRANVFGGAHAPGDAVPPLMTWDELGTLARDGQLIGAHGSMHLRLSRIEAGELEDEIAGAGRRLEQRLGVVPDWYAYAFGDIGSINEPAMQTILRHYRFCRTGIRGKNGTRNPASIVHAQEIDLSAGGGYHRAILNSAFDLRYFFARRAIERYAHPK